jgi:kynurenine formamidase
MELKQCQIIDLTQPLSPNAPSWHGSCGFCLDITSNYDDMFRVNALRMDAGIGTHIDAPAHLIPGGASVADIPCKQCIVPACIFDVSKKAHADYSISLKDVEEFEVKYGSIAPHSLVIGFTGWSRYWGDPIAYRNVDILGQMHFPTFSAQAVDVLIKRNISGIAIDTLSPDCLDHTFPVHRLVLSADKYIIENVADCSQMPPQGGCVVCLPLKCQGGTESPIRMIGLVP